MSSALLARRAVCTAANVCQRSTRSSWSQSASSRRALLPRHQLAQRRVLPAISRHCSAMATKEGVLKAPYQPKSIPTFSTSDAAPGEWSGDLLAIGVPAEAISTEGDAKSISDEALKELDGKLGGILSEIVATCDFAGKLGSSGVLRYGGDARFVALVGLGKGEAMASETRRGRGSSQAAGAAVVAACKASKCKTAAVAFVGAGAAELLNLQELAYGVVAAPGESDRFKSEPAPAALESVAALTAAADGADAALKRGVALARGNLFARYLVEAPPNVCSPAYLAGAAAEIAEQYECMSLEVLERADCEGLGMGCYLGVAQGSDAPPKFIHLTYKPPGGATKKVAIIGKGVTFDTGGYNLKAGPGSLIEQMKFDMGGAAATFGAARAVAELQPNVEVHFISASCENMVNGTAYRPGDVLVSASGKTVEIGNTDAEGRLTMCDALWYAQEKVGASTVIDIATLTGAQIVALGKGMGAVLSKDEGAAAAFNAAGRPAGEKWWPLPLEEEYEELLKSKCADMNNIGGRWAGTITAGLFLQRFINEGTWWAHLDMAGPVWSDAHGPTGFGAASLAMWVEQQAE